MNPGTNEVPGMPEQPRGKKLFWLAFAVALLALAAAVTMMLAGFGARWGWWHFRTGFQLLRWGAYASIALIVISGLLVFFTRPGTGRRGLPFAVVALIIALVLVGNAARWSMRARSVPPIHDITTDTENPPQFIAIAPLRADAPNPAEYGGAEVAVQQREAYPDIQPMLMTEPPETAFQRALSAAREMGWEIVNINADSLRIEATDRTFWFGFRDDIAVRLTPAGGRTVLDVRSKSRVGRSDVGTNAARIRKYLETIRS
jgi:uncharacterized protein (DUF1499 family)